MIPAAISVAFENSVSTLTTPSNSTDLLPYNYNNTLHIMNKYFPFQGRVNRGCFCRKHGQKDATKIQGSISPHTLIRTKKYYCHLFSSISS